MPPHPRPNPIPNRPTPNESSRRGVLALGVDGGGSSTTTLAADATGAVVGRGLAGPCNPKAIGVPAALGALEASMRGALASAGADWADVSALATGLAGFDRPAERESLRAWLSERAPGLPPSRIVAANDAEIVLAAAFGDGPGVALIAGTGSIAIGRGIDGKTIRAGGWGPLIGDEGGAYRFALDALRLTARRADGRAPRPEPDRLTETVLALLGVDRPESIVIPLHAPDMDRARIAALARDLVAIAEDDPAFKAEALDRAAADLAELADAVARRRNPVGSRASASPPAPLPLPLAMAGSFLIRASGLRAGVVEALRARGWSPEPKLVEEPALGAVRLALRTLEPGTDAEHRGSEP